MANWPWQRRINPHYEEVKAESDAWFRTFNVFGSWERQALDKCDFCLLSALAYPTISKAHLRTTSDFMILFFLVDDHLDTLSPSEAKACADIVMDALRDPTKPRPKNEDMMGELFREFWSREVQMAKPLAQKHFIDKFGECLYSHVEQAADREKGNIRGIEEYINLRRYTIGAYPCFPVPGMNLIEGIWNHHVIEGLKDIAVEMIFLDNDMCSYKKELEADAADHNIITIVMREKGTDIAGAMEWLGERRRKLTNDFIRLLDKVPSYTDPNLDHHVHVYVEGIGNWPLANYCWSFETRRYFGSDGLQIQKHRIVTIKAGSKPEEA